MPTCEVNKMALCLPVSLLRDQSGSMPTCLLDTRSKWRYAYLSPCNEIQIALCLPVSLLRDKNGSMPTLNSNQRDENAMPSLAL